MPLSKTDKVLIPALVAGGGTVISLTWFMKELPPPNNTYWDVIKGYWTQPYRYNPLILGGVVGTGAGVVSYLIQR